MRSTRIWSALTALATVVAVAIGLATFTSVSSAQNGQGPERSSARGRPTPYEIWAVDQGTSTIHIYDRHLQETDQIVFNPVAGATNPNPVTVPHMIDFDSQYRYAFIASTVSGNVTVIRAADREVVAIIPTGRTAHMVAVTPDDSAVWVANIGSNTLVEITLDFENERFEQGRTLAFASDPLYQAWLAEFRAANTPGNGTPLTYTPGPVCHEYSADGRYAWVTFGPNQGGLVVVDLEAPGGPRVDSYLDPAVVKANCGLARSADGRTMYANWGRPRTVQTDGEWYVFDIATRSLLSVNSSRGADVHGVRLTPDGRHLWQVNRETSNALVIDTRTNRVVHEVPWVGNVPDILDYSPDGAYAFITLRGPNPRSGAHATRGDTPGFSVVNLRNRKVEAIVQPAEGNPLSDFHAIAVRSLVSDRAHVRGTGPTVHLPGGPPGTTRPGSDHAAEHQH